MEDDSSEISARSYCTVPRQVIPMNPSMYFPLCFLKRTTMPTVERAVMAATLCNAIKVRCIIKYIIIAIVRFLFGSGSER